MRARVNIDNIKKMLYSIILLIRFVKYVFKLEDLLNHEYFTTLIRIFFRSSIFVNFINIYYIL